MKIFRKSARKPLDLLITDSDMIHSTFVHTSVPLEYRGPGAPPGRSKLQAALSMCPGGSWGLAWRGALPRERALYLRLST